MRILIKSLRETRKFIPRDRTYLIRISSYPKSEDYSNKDLKSPDYFDIKRYSFSDVYPNYYSRFSIFNLIKNKENIFSDEVARKIILDFKNSRSNCETLLIHCRHGRGRSPAVAIALNEIFNLGENSFRMKLKYPFYNRFVYEKLMQNKID